MMNDELCVVHPRAAGLDVHKAHITATVRLAGPGAAEPRFETRMFNALASGLAALVDWLTGHRIKAAALEATGVYWHTPWQALTDAGIESQFAPRPARQAAPRSKDRRRGQPLARSRVPVRVGAAQLRPVPAVPRPPLVEPPPPHARRPPQPGPQSGPEGPIDRGGVRIGTVLSDIFGTNGRRVLDGLVHRLDPQSILASLSWHVRRKLDRLGDALSLTLRDTERRLLADLLTEHDTLSRRVADFDRHIDQALEPYAEQRRLLETLPGIDRTAACAILSEIGTDPHAVFGNAHRLAAWAGLCPGNNESAGKRRAASTRRGNRTLRAVLIESAHAAARTNNCQFQAYHRALTTRRGYKRAIVATAHKLLRCIFAVLRDGTPYRDPATDYEALLVQRNAPRWLRKLQQFDILVHNPDGTCSVHWPSAPNRSHAPTP